MSGRAAVLASQRSSDVFADAQKLQYEMTKGFARHDERHDRFKQQLLRETRKHHQCICDAACAASNVMSTAASSALLFAQHGASELGDNGADASASAAAVVRRAQDAQWDIASGLRSFYTPPDASTGVVCDVCCAFRSAALALALPLPAPWQEFVCEHDASRHYYYHPETRDVRWQPPPGTSALAQLVFDRTNSVLSVCKCKPTRTRRLRLMQEFRDHAESIAATETEKRDRELRGAFSSLALSFVAPASASSSSSSSSSNARKALIQ